ncbi:hypothetical protein GCM10027187_40540 [Streptosporangium sandarakinum]|uniref:Uncharacterized protein n=1 Tax=Streptosporangium sandarakinum TaxID=1260955 RepID=A0A852V910_9ACTN|nr:hypothetical protein [Streptosporangium sandarakinum]NYF44616.1 hypothetical protein [Streptosporangium sandarakinum]
MTGADPDDFLELDQADPGEEEPGRSRRPWARCRCGRRIWAKKSLLLGEGGKCRRGRRRPGRLRTSAGRRYSVTGQTDLFTTRETFMSTFTTDQAADLVHELIADDYYPELNAYLEVKRDGDAITVSLRPAGQTTTVLRFGVRVYPLDPAPGQP